ncbi:MAG: hypothetical protein CVT92_00915 [Bacteroidetes bacterium HGW-Bacteroidetes-1]|nr:MAG: hypothetical protein CVT92_00915 [Bacteroidetes bacterium HGW-Bacteroidetes-1]
MKINELYNQKDINNEGLVEYPVRDIKAKVYINGTKVFFFELVNNQQCYRLYSIINKRSLFL